MHAAPVSRQVAKPYHWTVKTNYRLRVASFLNMAGSVAFHIWGQGYSPALWAAFSLHLLVYPHVAFWVARRAADSREAEIRNLLMDSFLFGVLVAALQFPLWITTTVYIASTVNIVITRGAWGFQRSQLAFAGGVLLAMALFGAGFAPDTGLPATLLCIAGNVVYMTAIGLTAYRRNQQLRETREQLRLQARELAATLIQLQETQSDLVEAEKLAALGSLVAGVAHELNTPIGNALMTATAMEAESKNMANRFSLGAMKRSAFQAFLTHTHEMTELIVRSCQKAAKLIASFKKVAVDHSSEGRRSFNVHDVVADNLVTLKPNLGHASLTIHNRVPALLECDSYPGALGQVLGGLVHNAAVHAFAPATPGEISIDAHADAINVTLTVRDNGNGMSPDVLKHAFDPFFTTRLGQGGNGLGLTICRNIVAGVLGGTLRVESEAGLGTCFFIEFPRQAPASQADRHPMARV
jgi:signal transduction histidine kinase